MKTAPLTNSQMMIWMGQELDVKDPLYSMPLTFEILGEINVAYFKTAFQKLVNANDTLRMFIGIENDMPVQLFKEKVESPLRFLDFTNQQSPEKAFEKWLLEDKLQAFDTRSTLYRAVLFKLDESKFVFYLNQHHLITDGWSVKLLYDQLGEFYLTAENQLMVPESEQLSFESYAHKNPFVYESSSSSFWNAKLENNLEKPPLYGLKVKRTKTGSTRVNFSLGKERTKKLKALSQNGDIKGLTMELALSNIFLTVIGILIYKVGNQEEFIVGMANHNRSSLREKKTMGLFMELLPLSMAINAEDTFLDIFKKVRLESLNVLKNAMIARPPIELLKTFNVLFNFIPAVYDTFAGIPTKCNWLLADHVDSNHHIRLQVHDFNNDGEYQLHFDLNNTVFSKAQYDFIGQHFITLLDAFIADKNQKICNVPIVSLQELKHLKNWNNTTRTFKFGETLLDKFETQVHENPNNTALVFENRSLSYLEFSQKANQVAHFLIQNGVGKNDIVGLSLERSLEMMIFLYGILKAGAAYMPIDTATPRKRIEYVLRSSKAKVFFHRNLEWSNLDNANSSLHFIDDLEVGLKDFPNTAPDISIHPNDLAYVIYTSGSTGEPKGVMCHHKGICNRLNWVTDDHPVSHTDIFIQKTPITFDVSSWELFWPLQYGARLIIERPDGHLNPEGLIETINTYMVSMAHFVPSMLNIFIKTKNVESCKSLKKLFCSGEALKTGAVKETHEKLNVDLYNFYGPTEAAIEVTSWHCKEEDDTGNIPIGFPGANVKIHLLDSQMHQVPIGVVGELYIAGVQVAHGYLNNRNLTEERFLEDPFSDIPNARMYRTGDLARYRVDGAIEYLGRVDTQVKLHGMRIELGEIEKSLENCHGIKEAVAKVMSQHGHHSLVAYYTGELLDNVSISNQLKETLPKYMIPSFFEHLDGFKLTSSGKIDRNQLPDISFTEKKSHSILEPANEFEEIIQGVWKEILCIDVVGVDENFTQLGGNSLNAMVITSRLKEAFELDFLSLVDVFNFPTIQQYAAFVEKTLIKLMQDSD